MHIRNLIIGLWIPVVLLSCKKSSEESNSSALTLFNTAYGSNPQQVMDIYLPPNRDVSNTMAMVMIHGGGWIGGDKSEFNGYIDTLKKSLPQYAIFNINYRLSAPGANLLAVQEDDINSALQFITDKIAEYQISQKVVLMGTSAGAHLALLHAYKHPNAHIKAVVDFFGPTDLVDGYNHSPNSLLPLQLIQVLGKPEEQDPELYRQFSPLEFVNPSSPPTIILHGGADLLVSVNQSVLLKQKLDAAGVINKLIIYPSEGHGWTGSNLIDSFNQVISFLVDNVN